MSDEDELPARVSWYLAKPPVRFGLSAEGDLQIEFGVETSLPGLQSRLGVQIPAAEAKTLLQNPTDLKTIQETLSAKPPAQGAH